MEIRNGIATGGCGIYGTLEEAATRWNARRAADDVPRLNDPHPHPARVEGGVQ